MDLGTEASIRALFCDSPLALEIKEVIEYMGDQINDAHWDKDKRWQQLYTHHVDTRSIIYTWTEAGDTISETLTTDYTPHELTSRVYQVVDKIIKHLNNPKGINHGPKMKVVRVMLEKLKAGGVIPPHIEDGNLLLSRRFYFVIQTNEGHAFTVDGVDSSFEEGFCYELNNAKTHSVINNGSQDSINLICDIQLIE